MRLLLDACIAKKAFEGHSDAGYDVEWVGLWPKDPGDEAIMALAYRESRVLVTLDKDFGEIAVVRRRPHAGLVRIVDFSSQEQGEVCIKILTLYRHDLEKAGIVTVTPNRVRVRPGER